MKQHNQDDIFFDNFDIETFYNFFKNLYTAAQPIESTRRGLLKQEATSIMVNNQLMTDPLARLNISITSNELAAAIKSLSNGKASRWILSVMKCLKILAKTCLTQY